MELKHELIKKELFCMYKKNKQKKTIWSTWNIFMTAHTDPTQERRRKKKNLYKGHGADADAFIYFIIIFNKVPFLFVFLTLKYVQHKTRQA